LSLILFWCLYFSFDLSIVDEGYTNEAGFTERFVKDTDKIQIRLLSNNHLIWVKFIMFLPATISVTFTHGKKTIG
jgi:hypothetical protein